MHVNKSFIFLWLAAVTLLARSANGQTYGFYSGWSIDEQSGYVYMWAESAADYQISYYYDLHVCMQLVVTPGQGNPFSTCWTQDWSDDNWAYVECSTTVPLNSDIYLDSYHEANVTYYVYNFLPDCWEQGNCYNWWDDRTGDYARALARYSYYPGKPVILGEFSFDAKVVEYTMNSLAGYSCWAFYPLPSEPNLNYLFDEKGNITPHGRSFAETAARLRQSEVVLHRAEDEAVLRVDPLKALTDPASTSDVYEEYMRMSAGGKVIGLEMDRPH